MTTVVAILKALVALELILIVLFFVVALLICMQVWAKVGLFHVYTREETRYYAGGLWLTDVLQALWYCAWWWWLGPLYVYRRLVKWKRNGRFHPPARGE